MGLGEVGLEPDRFAVLGDRLVELPLVAQGDAEVGVGVGEVGLEPDRLAARRDRRARLAVLQQFETEVDVGLGIPGLEADHRAALRDRVVDVRPFFPGRCRGCRGCPHSPGGSPARPDNNRWHCLLAVAGGA